MDLKTDNISKQDLNPIKKFSWSLYLLLLSCVFLPFMTVSCNDKKIFDLNGIQIITGKIVDNGKTTNIGTPAPFITVAFAATLVGLIATLVGKKRVSFIVGSAANVCSISMLLIFSIMYFPAENPDNVPAIGYWIYLFLNIIVLFIMLYLALSEDKKTADI